jgi:hypothetical protein
VCRAPILARFFTLRGLPLCPDCADKIVKRHEGSGRRRRAAILGLVAAAVFAVLWFLATRATGRPLSPLALAAGLVVGLAVHQGSGGRGGLRYQVIAALLVYATFVVRYVPPVFGGIATSIKDQHGARIAAEAKGDASVTTTSNRPPGQTQAGPATKGTTPAATPVTQTTSAAATLKAYLVFTLVAWGLVLAAPFMPGTSGLLGTILLVAGMALAWRLNRRARVLGPFSPSD